MNSGFGTAEKFRLGFTVTALNDENNFAKSLASGLSGKFSEMSQQVAQLLYVADPAKKTKHVVVPRKLDIIGVECIDDVEEYNQYDQMNLFTDLAQKMKIIEAGIRKDDKPWARKDGESRIVTA